MTAAMRALHKEDRALKKAFESCPSKSMVVSNKGLGYWLFESTLVYMIFKAWLPHGEVAWEAAYKNSRKKADLKVKVRGETWVIEAKWWPNTQKKTMKSLHSDINKMQKLHRERRFLLTFWISPCRAWSTERPEVENIGMEGVALRYIGRFRTDMERTRGKGGGSNFALALFEVGAPRSEGDA